MTDAQAIKQLRVMLSKLSDALSDTRYPSGLTFRETPLGSAAAKLLRDTDPEADPQQTLDAA